MNGTAAGRRALFVSFVANSRSTGMGKWTHEVADGLRRRGWEVGLLFAEDFPLSARAGRFAVLVAPLAIAAALFRRRREFDAAVVHEPSAFWCALLARVLPSAPRLVAMSHGVESNGFRALLAAERAGLAQVGRGSRIKAALLRRWQSDGALRMADKVLCLSASDAEYLRSELGIPPERIARFVNGVDGAVFGATDPGADRPGRRVLVVAPWIDRKGSRALPRLWARVRDAVPDARLTLVGTFVGAEAIRPDFRAEDRASVEAIPRVEDALRMAELYASHDIFLMPSLFEGSPLSLLEAMAAGKAVAASRVCGIPDIVTDPAAGVLFDPLDPEAAGDAVAGLLTEPDRAREAGRRAKERARELTWDATAEAVARALEDATKKRRTGGT